jgi:hypothetical protein
MAQQGGRPDNRTILAIVLVVVLAVFALLNWDTVTVSFVIFSLELPLFVMLVLAGAVGVAAGFLISGRRRG